MEPVKVGVIGCGNICSTYLRNATGFDAIDIVACADLVRERASAHAAEFGVRACTVDEILADSEIEAVLNLTLPAAHFELAMAALEAGKSVYNEKPLAVKREEGAKLVETARAKGLRLGCAPDTFLGAGQQTSRKLIDDGAIGEPVAASAFIVCHGHERWHPSPEFFYKLGAGPVFDMGPYYLTALVSLLGPVERVTGSARMSFPERTITSEPKRGEKIKVEVATHVTAVLDFASGAVGTLIASYDIWAAHLPPIEIYGSEGTLGVPDPNAFGGPVTLKRSSDEDWAEQPLTHAHAGPSRAIGLADQARAMRSGRPHRASGELAYHVLDIMHAILEASETGRHVRLESTCERPEPFPPGMAEGEIPA